MANNMQIVPAGKVIEPQFVEMKVPLYSYGCKNKIKKALSNLKGIHSVHVDYNLQKVTVWGICNREDVLAVVRKKRRDARFWDDEEESFSADDQETTIIDDEMEKSNIIAADRRSLRLSKLLLSSLKFRRSWKKLFPHALY